MWFGDSSYSVSKDQFSTCSRGRSASTKLRVGFVGAGFISAYHFRAVKAVPHAHVVAIADIIPERAQESAERFKIARAYPSIEELLKDDIDVLHVLTPARSHFKLALAGLQASCHVFVEKPFTCSLEECDRLVEEARHRNQRICVDHSLLGDPTLRQGLELIRRGVVGDVQSVHVFRCGRPPRRIPWRPPYVHLNDPFREVGVHALYCVLSILGSIHHAVCHVRSTGRQKHFKYDEWSAQLECETGLAQIHLTWNGPPHQVIEVRGNQGQLKLDLSSSLVLQRRNWPATQQIQLALNPIRESVTSVFQVGKRSAGYLLGASKAYRGLHAMTYEFYRVLQSGGPMPVRHAEVQNVVSWIERIASHVQDMPDATHDAAADSA